MTAPSPIDAVLGRAGRALMRRWPLYLGVAIALFGLLTGFEALHVLKAPLGQTAAQIIFFPLGVAVVNAFIAADIQAEAGAIAIPNAAIWERIGERAWAVFALDLIASLVSFGQIFLTGDLALFFYSTGAIILAALLAFADVHAIVEPELRASNILQKSILVSVRIAMTRTGYIRALLLIMVQYLASDAFHGSPPMLQDAAFSLMLPPFAAIATAIYLDLAPAFAPGE